jgi:hypothetical protein
VKIFSKKSSLFFLLLILSNLLNARTWTNQEGKQIQAEFISLQGEAVVIRMQGRTYTIPLKTLSEQDQEFAKAESIRLAREAEERSRQFMNQTLEKGKLHIFTHPLSEANQAIARKGGSGWDDSFSSRYSGSWIKDLSEHHDLKEIKIALGIPDDFNPQKGSPIFVQWSTSDQKSHVRGARGYWKDCRKKGWILVSIEGSPDPATTWSNSVFYAGIREFFAQLHAKYPGSETWPVATGGFSGGAKICQWMGGLLSEMPGVEFRGFWIGGCNEALFDFALKDMSVSKRSFRGKKAFISSGDSDRLVSERHRKRVQEGAEKVGLQVRSEIYEGGHKRNSPHFLAALDWFLEE